MSHWLHALGLLAWVLGMAVIFAKVEIHIEGPHGWAEKLPTWRIEDHWLLRLLWGGRAMTGYHAWMFSFIATVFHLPLLFTWHFHWTLELRALACLMIFWIAEDFLWFVLNPDFGLRRFTRQHVSWHKHWIFGAPIEYWTFGLLAALLLTTSFLYDT